MAFDFPNSPSTGSTHSTSGATYVYDGEKWVVSTSFTGTINIEDEIPAGTISSSAQIEAVITDAYISSSVNSSNIGFDGNYNNLNSVPIGIVSSSAQITSFGFVSESVGSTPAGTISGSAQITDLGFTSGSHTDISHLATTGSNTFKGDTQVFGGTATTALQIGDTYQGGTVFYVSDNLSLIAQTSDLSSNAPDGSAASGSDGAGLGDGLSNTNNIVSEFPLETTSAAHLAYLSTAGGYSDWYLPSTLEMVTLISNLGSLGGAKWYFVSTLGSGGQYYVTVRGDDGLALTAGNNISGGYVRAIRQINTGVRPSDSSTTSVTISGSLDVRDGITGSLDYSNLTNVPSGLVSGSTQITDGSNIVSGSVLRTLDGTGVVSGSAQITALGFVSESGGSNTSINTFTESIQSEVDSLTAATSSYLTSLPSGTISGSAQIDRTWTLGADGSSHYTFTGPGLTGTENDPTLYLTRGETYRFVNEMGAHPFRIQSDPNGSTGTQYNDGVTNNDVSNGTLIIDVQFDAPSRIYYQCTAHPNMGGVIEILEQLPSGLVSGSSQIADLGYVSSSTVDTIQVMTSASYSGITPVSGTLYIIQG